MAYKSVDLDKYQELDVKTYQQIVPTTIPGRAAWLYAPVDYPRETRLQLDTANAIQNAKRDSVQGTKFSQQMVPVQSYPGNPRESRVTDRENINQKIHVSAAQYEYSKAGVKGNARPIDSRANE